MNFKELATKYPQFLAFSEADGALEMFLDHHSLSQMRMCEDKFMEEIVHCVHPRGARYWALEFGVWIHECLDPFYDAFRKTGKPPDLQQWTKNCLELWDDYDLSYFKPDPLKTTKEMTTDQKKYHAFGGREGATAFLLHYYAFYMTQRLRVVATEVSFGRKKEVLLGEFRFPISWNTKSILSPLSDTNIVRVFLTGRIDLLGDNTYKIGPIDHKSTGRFDGYESNDFDPHEGITGYIYAIDRILGTQFPDNPHKVCRDGWIYHISTNASDEPRFKATLITKTPGQLEEYRLRQLRTAKRILEVISGEVPDRNTLVCNNIYNKPCPYKELHRQPTEQREGTIKQFYEIRPAWNPEKPPSLRKERKEAVPSDEHVTQ